MPTGPSILVAGGGIAGLSAALALQGRGFEVTVAERANAFGEVGAGIQIGPNGMAVLRGLGLSDAVVSRSVGASGVHLVEGRTGRAVTSMSLTGSEATWRLIHRSDLIDILLKAATDAGAKVETSRAVSAPKDGSAPEGFGLLIGADGIRSSVRLSIDGPSNPFFTGQAAWRAVVADPEPTGIVQVHMGAGRHLVTYSLPGNRRNIVAVEERGVWTDDGWHQRDDPQNLALAFADFAAPVRDLLDRVDDAHIWGLFRTPIARKWSRGAQVLIGDAAHPTLPFLAQGANLALEDAWVLSSLLASRPQAEALAAFQIAREARVARAIKAANGNARRYHLSGLSAHVAHTGLRMIDRVAPSLPLRAFDWLYGHDVTLTHP